MLTHLLENGFNIRVVQELMGHADVKITEIYTHVMQKNLNAVESGRHRSRATLTNCNCIYRVLNILLKWS